MNNTQALIENCIIDEEVIAIAPNYNCSGDKATIFISRWEDDETKASGYNVATYFHNINAVHPVPMETFEEFQAAFGYFISQVLGKVDGN